MLGAAESCSSNDVAGLDLEDIYLLSDCMKCKSSIRARKATWSQKYKLYCKKKMECNCHSTMLLEPSLFMQFYRYYRTKDYERNNVITLD